MAKGNGSTRNSTSNAPRGFAPSGTPEGNSRLANGSFAIDSPEVRTYEAVLDRQYPVAPEIKFAVYRTVADSSDAYDILRVIEDKRSGRASDTSDRVDVVSLNIGTDKALHPRATVRTADLIFFRTKEEAERHNRVR